MLSKWFELAKGKAVLIKGYWNPQRKLDEPMHFQRYF